APGCGRPVHPPSTCLTRARDGRGCWSRCPRVHRASAGSAGAPLRAGPSRPAGHRAPAAGGPSAARTARPPGATCPGRSCPSAPPGERAPHAGDTGPLLLYGFGEPGVQEGPRVGPFALGGALRATDQLGHLAEFETAEIAQFDDLAPARADRVERVQAFMQRQHLLVLRLAGDPLAQGDFDQAAAALGGTAPARLVDDDPAHGLGRGGEEVPAAVEAQRTAI